jgi:hypothetical protein
MASRRLLDRDLWESFIVYNKFSFIFEVIFQAYYLLFLVLKLGTQHQVFFLYLFIALNHFLLGLFIVGYNNLLFFIHRFIFIWTRGFFDHFVWILFIRGLFRFSFCCWLLNKHRWKRLRKVFYELFVEVLDVIIQFTRKPLAVRSILQRKDSWFHTWSWRILLLLKGTSFLLGALPCCCLTKRIQILRCLLKDRLKISFSYGLSIASTESSPLFILDLNIFFLKLIHTSLQSFYFLFF